LSRKIQALEARSAGGEGGAAGSEFNELKNSFSALAEKVNNFAQRVFDLQAEIDDIKNRYAKQDQLTELKFVIDAINPLQFTTLNQVDELIEKRLKESEKAAAKEKETKEAKETKKR
jgi:predicted  nucleic acid-binding Zn-ribbon protein